MITIVYPTYIPAIYKLVDRICRKNSSKILFLLNNKEGYYIITSIDPFQKEQLLEQLTKYSSLFRLF
jgi:hypothetical protein